MPRLIRALSWLAARSTPWTCAALAFVLTLPALSLGIVLDDWFQRARILGIPPLKAMEHPIRELFVFLPREGEYAQTLGDILGWWKSPDLELVFFRPLSAATQVLDWKLAPDLYPLHHLHSLLWFALAVAAVAWTYRQAARGLGEAGSPSSLLTAGLAALFFAVEDAHGLPAAWLANRNALLALLFGALALGSHLRWRDQGRLRWGLASWVALALGLFSGESALEATAYLFAWEVFVRRDPLWRRALALVPAAAVTLAWRLVYDAMGCRTWGSGHYIDPGRQPWAFLREAPLRAVVLNLGQWTQVQTDLYLAMSRPVQVALAGAGFLLLLFLGAVFWRTLKEEPQARFWATGSLLALVPACATFPMDRLLTFSGIGAFGLLALQVRRLGWLGHPAAGPHGRLVRWSTGALVGLHLVLAPPLLSLRTLSPRLLFGVVEEGARVVPGDAPVQGETWVVVNGFDLFVSYIRIIRGGLGMTVPRSVEMLASVMSDLEVTRLDERTLRVRTEGGWLRHDLERLVRAADIPFTPGQRVRRPTMEARVVEVTPDGRPLVVDFLFDVPLEDPSLRWLQADGLTGSPFTLPALGETVKLQGVVPAAEY